MSSATHVKDCKSSSVRTSTHERRYYQAPGFDNRMTDLKEITQSNEQVVLLASSKSMYNIATELANHKKSLAWCTSQVVLLPQGVLHIKFGLG